MASSDHSENQDEFALLWQRLRPKVLERIEGLSTTVGFVASDAATREAIKDAATQAHRLAGSLGTFGFPCASAIARQIELNLQEASPDSGRLTELVAKLADALRIKPPQT